MGWWPFGGKGDIHAKKLPQDQQPPAAEQQAQELLSKQLPEAADLLGGSLPRPTSIFEFGEPVPVGGELLRGGCAGSDPDAITACTWSLEKNTGKKKAPMFRVEF